MFSFIKKTLTNIYASVTSKLASLFSKNKIDANTLKELEIILLAADTGVTTTKSIIKRLQEQYDQGELKEGASLKTALHNILLDILNKPKQSSDNAQIFILVGINGSGKTTFASKLAHHYTKQGKKVLFVAADTFRAAAQEQLNVWATETGCAIVHGKPQQDPASVVYTGCQQFITQDQDILIIDTAGRLQTKINLMNELAKLKRVIEKQLPSHRVHVLLTIDSMLGQNSLEQARLFKECTQVDGIVLTKMDGTGKGGIVFAIADELEIPIKYITFGEQISQMKLFDPKEYVENLLHL
ncbi:signal recognition particle-docking protein FtsY [Candidatus Dependentiae bacterium]|nr:MAG: signal recognition particle-docking protein FtsY [Candidatus Dependentiae bacterium]